MQALQPSVSVCLRRSCMVRPVYQLDTSHAHLQVLAQGDNDRLQPRACRTVPVHRVCALTGRQRLWWQALAETGDSDMEDALGGAAPFEAWVRYGSASPAAAASQASAHPEDGGGSPTGPVTPTPGGGGGAPWDIAQAATTLAPAELVLQCALQQVSAIPPGQC